MTDGNPVKVLESPPVGAPKEDGVSQGLGDGAHEHRITGPGLAARVAKNVAAIMAGRGLSVLLSAAASILLVRFLGAERLGEFGAIYAYLALFSWLATFGFEPVLVREISRDRANAGSLLRTATALSVLLSVGTVVIAVLLAPGFGYGGHLRDLLALAALEYVLTPIRLPAVIFQVDMRQWYGATINVIRQAFWLAVVALLWALHAGLLYIIAGRVAGAILESALIWIYGRRHLEGTSRFLRDRARMIFSHSFPIAFTSLLVMIYLRIDQVMLHKMVNDTILGQYVAATRVSELFELVPSALLVTLAPVLSVTVADPPRFRTYTDGVFRYFMLAAAALCVFIATAASLIVRLLFGKQFLPAGPLLAVLIWSEIAVFFATVISNVLVVKNEQRLLPIPTLLGAALNIGLNLVLIPRYAAAGSAWATLVSYTLAWMVGLLFFRQTRSLAWQGLRFAAPIVGMALVSVGCAVALPVPQIARVVAACLLFGICVWTARFIHVADLQHAWEAARESFSV